MISEHAKEAINRIANEIANIEAEIGNGEMGERAQVFNSIAARTLFRRTATPDEDEGEALANMLRSSAIAIVAAALLIERHNGQ